jgi:hypothetical protein
MYGPDKNFDVLAELSSGTTVRLTGYTPDEEWLRVMIDNGEMGFIPAGSLKKGIGKEIPENSKIFTGKDFKATKFIDHGVRRQIRHNDSYIIDARHQVTIDGYGRISRMDFKKNTGKGVRMNVTFSPDATQINFSDGTKLEIKNGKFTLSHAGIELTPATRQKFATGYGSGGMVPPSNGGNGR